MWRKFLHQSLGLFDGSYRIAGGYEFFLKASLAAGAYPLAEPLGLYFESSKSLSYSDPSAIAKEISRFLPRYRRTIPVEKIYPYLEKECSAKALSMAHTDLGIQFIHPLALIEPEAAEFHFRKALELDPSAPEGILNLIISLEDQGKTTEAARLVQGLGSQQAESFSRLKTAVAQKPGAKGRVSMNVYRPSLSHQK